MLADDGAARSVWLGENGAFSGAASGTIVIESSTVTVSWIKELAAAATKHGCELLDAPVTGSKLQAASGELRFLVGGSRASSKSPDRCSPCLETTSSTSVPAVAAQS